jgi:hypothetical protein
MKNLGIHTYTGENVYTYAQGAGNVYIDLIRNDLHSYMLTVFGYGKIYGYIELISFLHKFINEYFGQKKNPAFGIGKGSSLTYEKLLLFPLRQIQ